MGLECLGEPILPRDPWNLGWGTANVGALMGLRFVPSPPTVFHGPQLVFPHGRPAPLPTDPFAVEIEWIQSETAETYSEFVERRRSACAQWEALERETEAVVASIQPTPPARIPPPDTGFYPMRDVNIRLRK